MLSERIPFWELLLVIDERGFTIYSYSYDFDLEKHALLMGGLFMGIDSLFTLEFDDELREIKGEKYHVSVLKKSVNSIKLLFVGLTHSTICENKRVKELEFVARQFTKRFAPEINRIDTLDNFCLFTSFNDVPKTRKNTALTQISESLQFNPKMTLTQKFSRKKVKKEVLRILAFLKLPRMLAPRTCEITRKIHEDVIGPRSKFRQIKKLVPLILYLYCGSLGIVINNEDLINTSNITKKELYAIKTQIRNYIPKYSQDKLI